MPRRFFWARVSVILAVLLGLAVLGFGIWTYATNWRPSPEDFPVQGVDVSEEQGALNWWSLKATGIGFGYARATDGADHRDAQFADNWAALSATGIARGAIHRFSLCAGAAAQARNFVTTVPRSDDMLPAVLELDFTEACKTRPDRDAVIGQIQAMLVAMETHTGKHALLKVARRFEAQYHVSEAIPRRLWSTQPFLQPGYLARPWTMWQASSFRRVAGIEVPINWDVIAK